MWSYLIYYFDNDDYLVGAFQSKISFRALKTSVNGRKISLINKFFPNSIIVKFPKSDPFNRHFREGNQVERAFPVRRFLKVALPFELIRHREFPMNSKRIFLGGVESAHVCMFVFQSNG